MDCFVKDCGVCPCHDPVVRLSAGPCTAIPPVVLVANVLTWLNEAPSPCAFTSQVDQVVDIILVSFCFCAIRQPCSFAIDVTLLGFFFPGKLMCTVFKRSF